MKARTVFGRSWTRPWNPGTLVTDVPMHRHFPSTTAMFLSVGCILKDSRIPITPNRSEGRFARTKRRRRTT